MPAGIPGPRNPGGKSGGPQPEAGNHGGGGAGEAAGGVEKMAPSGVSSTTGAPASLALPGSPYHPDKVAGRAQASQQAARRFGPLEGAGGPITKSNSPTWKQLQPFRGQTKTNGLSGSKRQYYEWDHTHNDIEVYDSSGRHLGSMDPTSGQMIKPPVEGRTIDVS